jgi:hypothetical protein
MSRSPVNRGVLSSSPSNSSSMSYSPSSSSRFVLSTQDSGTSYEHMFKPQKPQKKTQMPREDMITLKHAFNLFDRDGDGQIQIDELYSVLKSLKLASDQELKYLLGTLHDTDTIDFYEFVRLLRGDESSDDESDEEENIVTKRRHSTVATTNSTNSSFRLSVSDEYTPPLYLFLSRLYLYRMHGKRVCL